MPQGAIHQMTVPSRRRPGVVGMPAYLDNLITDFLSNSDPAAREVYTLTIDTATDSEVYGLDVTDPISQSVSVNSGTGSSVNSIASAFADEWNATPLAAMLGTAAANAAVVTITGNVDGYAFTLAEDENAAKVTLANPTDAGEAADVPFGRAIVSLGAVANEADEAGVLAQASKLVQQSDAYLLTYNATDVLTFYVDVDGEVYSFGYALATDLDTSGAAIAAALDTLLSAVDLSAAYDAGTDTLAITADTAGQAFRSWVTRSAGATATATKSSNDDNPLTDFNKSFAGVSMHTRRTMPASQTDDTAVYAGGKGVQVMTRGDIWVELDAGVSVTSRSAVYVELGASNSGRFYTSNASSRVKVKGARWRHAAHGASGPYDASDASMAILSIDLLA